MLEEKIEKLTKSVDALRAAMEGFNMTVPAITEKAEPETETKAKDAETSITAEELQDICLSKVRENSANKPKIKKIIESYGGTLIKDVDENKFSELKRELEAL